MPSTDLFETTSLVKAAFLELRLGLSCGIQFNNPKSAVFLFPRTAEVLSAAASFEVDGQVPAKRFSRSIGVLRDRLIGLRSGNFNVDKMNGNERRTEITANVNP